MQDLDARALHFITKVNPYRSVADVDAQTGEYVIRLVQDVIQPPSNEWGSIIGDVAHNLMSALDHLVCQLAVLNGGHAECEDTAFPIFDVDSTFARAAIARRIGTLSPGDRQIIRDLQPYAQGDRAPDDPLWRLYRLNVIDKHRRMHLVNTGLFDKNPLLARGYAITDLMVSEGTKAGDEIFRFREGPPFQTDDDVNTNVIVVVKFGPGSGPLTGRSVRTELPALYSYVCNDVFPKFEHRVGKLPPVGDVSIRHI